ncbi:hypothetical protein [Haliangium sp.]|uniref:hypothetical protein n=1 Tax=Haliangium sp. TaxID=2663208 RepID=UPI003D0D8A1B
MTSSRFQCQVVIGALVLTSFGSGCTFDTSAPPIDDVIIVPTRLLVPSNDARIEHLEGVNVGLTVPTGLVVDLDTDTGEISIRDGATVRASGEGVVDGIGFYRLDNGASLLAVGELEVGKDGSLWPVGSRPLIVLSEGDIVVEGDIDVSAPCDGETLACAGPGGGNGSTSQSDKAQGCAPGGNGAGLVGTANRTGGGGGGLREDGASGGTAGSGTVAGGSGGELDPLTCPNDELVPFTGGSGGGAGGLDTYGGDGGGGGGALQLTSFTSIEVRASASDFALGIFANGGGGGGAYDGGGGGGGSGGVILLEAPAITLRSVRITANGGGGGSGGGRSVATEDGESGQPNAEPASGGSGGGFPGGAGGTGTVSPQPGWSGGIDTGGGGGSAGIIRFHVDPAALIREGSIIEPAPIIAEPRWSEPGADAGE